MDKKIAQREERFGRLWHALESQMLAERAETESWIPRSQGSSSPDKERATGLARDTLCLKE